MENREPRIYAVIAAAGAGSRMGPAPRSKVLLPFENGQTVLDVALAAMAQSGVISGAAVAARSEDFDEVAVSLSRALPGCDNLVVRGGETRQESVYNALCALRSKATHVLVHDAARPFCPPELIRQTAECCVASGGCILAARSKCTLKKVEDGVIKDTIPRAVIWEAQTPQAFELQLLLRAYETALAQRYTGTDDSELVERLGFPVRIIEGPDSNIKITTAYDLEHARLLVNQREN